MTKKMTTEQWVEKAKARHGNYYDYSRVDYQKATEKVVIGCPNHGFVKIIAGNHMKGNKCFKCAKEEVKLARSGVFYKNTTK